MDKANLGKLAGHKDSLVITNPSKAIKSGPAKMFKAAKAAIPKAPGKSGYKASKGC